MAVEDESEKNKEEYIIPQLLLQWVKQDADFDGIRYKSSSSYEDIEMVCGHNLVLPTNEFDKDGYDIRLREYVKVGMPEVFEIKGSNPYLEGLESISEDYQRI